MATNRKSLVPPTSSIGLGGAKRWLMRDQTRGRELPGVNRRLLHVARGAADLVSYR
jgi:hypothetical protein